MAEAHLSVHKRYSYFKPKLTAGHMFNVSVLNDCVRDNIGDLTFYEAYNKTRRILNITVSASGTFEMPRLLNYLTAPNVVYVTSCLILDNLVCSVFLFLWKPNLRAASCAIPYFYRPQPLFSKDRNGKVIPWNPSGCQWIDGSVEK
jgi:predicted acylesterase/phospholipase RssA